MHAVQSHVEEFVSDTTMFLAWAVSWVAFNVFFLGRSIHVKNREVDLVHQLGLTKTAEASWEYAEAHTGLGGELNH